MTATLMDGAALAARIRAELKVEVAELGDVGLATVLARVKEYRARFGDYWQPAPLLERLVAEGRSFYEAEPQAAAR